MSPIGCYFLHLHYVRASVKILLPTVEERSIDDVTTVPTAADKKLMGSLWQAHTQMVIILQARKSLIFQALPLYLFRALQITIVATNRHYFPKTPLSYTTKTTSPLLNDPLLFVSQPHYSSMRYSTVHSSSVPSAAAASFWLLVGCLCFTTRITAFQIPPSKSSSFRIIHQSQHAAGSRLWANTEKDQQPQRTKEEEDVTATDATTTTTTTTTQEEKLSDMDARVLRSMLQDSDKLDLKTEENLKKLLERGVVSKQVPQDAQQAASTSQKKKKKMQGLDDESEFSSQVLQTLSDTKLWKALSRKAGDWVESATLYLVNRVERDAMTLAALGAFAWDRAVRDVGRALPAAGGSSSSSGSIDSRRRRGPFYCRPRVVVLVVVRPW